MQKLIDLRSDTVTLPTQAMREAMYRAEVGDSGHGEDPTVDRLQEMIAEIMDKEAGLFVVSGTMGNLASILTHCERGDEVILGDRAHTFQYEAGGASALGGVSFHTVPNDRLGMLDPNVVENAVHPTGLPPISQRYYARTGLIALENTHNATGGTVLSKGQMDAICAVATRHGLPVHVDGARIFNAAVALGIAAKELVREADSVQICLTKGLCCPFGSLVVGRRAFIDRLEHTRTMLGGAMRQSGIMAAAGIVALEQMVDRLAEDHENARRLAEGLAEIPGLEVDLDVVQSNMVLPKVVTADRSPEEVMEALAEEGIRTVVFPDRRIRMVTHYGVDAADIDYTLKVMVRIMSG